MNEPDSTIPPLNNETDILKETVDPSGSLKLPTVRLADLSAVKGHPEINADEGDCCHTYSAPIDWVKLTVD